MMRILLNDIDGIFEGSCCLGMIRRGQPWGTDQGSFSLRAVKTRILSFCAYASGVRGWHELHPEITSQDRRETVRK